MPVIWSRSGAYSEPSLRPANQRHVEGRSCLQANAADALIADMMGVKAAPERTICAGWFGAGGTEAMRAESALGVAPLEGESELQS